MASERALRPPSLSGSFDQISDDGDDLNILPGGSIYAQLDYIQRTYAMYAVTDDDYDSYEEVSEDEPALDLSAPPPESWYHGSISRLIAYERLQQLGVSGCYLIRDSTNQPGDYAISYLSKLGQIHHFKINSTCGDYYIGGRQFTSLVDLIGYYTNCSCILENERLEVPVMPPRGIPLHKLLQSTSNYVKQPNTDELNVTAGEVFILLSRLNPEWAWAQSQKTREAGLIPITVMEDVTREDSNFGKPWFHTNISRDESLDLLMNKGMPGDFLVRAAAQPNMYSLGVRAHDSVQRFLIQKHATGYYVFGGRMFNSLDDIVERYQKEVILDGLRLKQPISPEMTPVIPHSSHRTRANSQAIRSEVKGDRSGHLQLKKGKKSPVHGKWKEFYFHLRYKEQKLLYFDDEQSHRPRGLLDLKECRIYSVHPSLYGRDDCFVIMLQYLNELSFHYICAGSASAAQEWLRLMRQCVNSAHINPEHRSEIQQIRSLSLDLKDCKLNKSAHCPIFCHIFVDGCCVGRTKPIPDQPKCYFDESYRFKDLPPYSSAVSVDLNPTKKKAFASSVFGAVSLLLNDLPNGQEFDKWHKLEIPGTKATKGSLRMIATFKHEVILPLEEYRDLKEIILAGDLILIETLSKVCSEHHSELAATLIEIFCHHQCVLQILVECLARAIDGTEQVATLFRASTLATMLMDQFMKLTAMDYLMSVLRVSIQSITTSTEPCELNPNNLPKGVDRTKNQEMLQLHISNILNEVYRSVEICPKPLQYIFYRLQERVRTKWPDDQGVRTRVVSGFLFLRFICPALLKPHLFNIVSEAPSQVVDRNLKLVTKSVQNVANLVEFKSKEPFMTVLNPFIGEHMDAIKKFVERISNVCDMPPVTHPSSDPARAWASLHRLCQTYEGKLKEVSLKEKKVVELLGVMQMLKATEERYLKSS